MFDRISEPGKVMLRRFTHRSLESGLLILAVALGVGAASAGLALLAHIREYSQEMLTSPAYREIVVSTHGEAEDMSVPVIEKPLRETTALTQADLAARDIVPGLTHAYLAEYQRLHFPAMMERFESARERFETSVPGNSESPEDSPTQGGPLNQLARLNEVLEEARGDENVINPDMENLSGRGVTPEFFLAWEMEPALGSLFTDADLLGTDSVIILGNDAAELLAGEEDIASLMGKKLLTFEGLTTIIGILKPRGDLYDGQFFAPARDRAAAAGSRGGFRGHGLNSQLRFAVSDPANLEEASGLLLDWFDRQFGQGQVVVSNPRAEAERLIARNSGIGFLILFLSLAGLFIASVNVSHILMGRALRMKRHIGILKALGTSCQGILRLFAVEAMAITLGGAALGSLLAMPLNTAMGEALDISGGSPIFLVLGILLSWILTLIFSLVPAWQGSRIEAARAMRSV